jgi:hypothetical protein
VQGDGAGVEVTPGHDSKVGREGRLNHRDAAAPSLRPA